MKKMHALLLLTLTLSPFARADSHCAASALRSAIAESIRQDLASARVEDLMNPQTFTRQVASYSARTLSARVDGDFRAEYEYRVDVRTENGAIRRIGVVVTEVRSTHGEAACLEGRQGHGH